VGSRASLLDGVRERFDASVDFTIGLEEEYQLLDPRSLALVNRFEELSDAATGELAERLAGELISSEIEYRTLRHDSFTTAARELVHGRLATLDLAESIGIACAITGVHPFSPWQEQRIIDTPHYALRDRELGYVAWTNNTWSIHLHAGVQGADRAAAVSTAMRSVLPELLALSANSPIYLGRPTRLASTRTQVFTRSFPRSGIPEAYPTWDEYAQFVDQLQRTNSIVEARQIWWSVRPAHDFGTVEVRICDGQAEMDEALAVSALSLACIAQFCAEYDAGMRLPTHPRAMIEENLWRALRYGIEEDLIDLDRLEERSAVGAIEALLEWSEPVHERLGLEPFLASIPATLRDGNGAMRTMRRMEELGDMVAVHRELVERTRASAQEALGLVGALASA
jgi:carboxylate-amine ligase